MSKRFWAITSLIISLILISFLIFNYKWIVISTLPYISIIFLPSIAILILSIITLKSAKENLPLKIGLLIFTFAPIILISSIVLIMTSCDDWHCLAPLLIAIWIYCVAQIIGIIFNIMGLIKKNEI